MSHISEITINCVDIPLDTEVLYNNSPFITETREALEDGTSLSRELALFHLKNQLV